MAEEVISILREKFDYKEVEWEIRNFFDLPHKKGYFLQSPTFLLNDTSWCLRIYPNRKDEWISLYLAMIESSGEHRVSVYFGAKVGDSVIKDLKFVNTFNKAGKKRGLYQFVKRSAVSNAMELSSSNGTFTVVCRIRLIDGRQHDSGIQNLSKRVEKLFLGGRWADVKLIVGEREFDAHKAILGARSPVFDAMFDHDMVENNTGVVYIPDFDPDHFEDFLLFIYSGKFDKITSKNALELYKAGDKYNLSDLKTECLVRMISEQSVDTILDIMLLAATHREEALLIKGMEYFTENCEKIFETDKWNTFFAKHTPFANEMLTEMVKLLKADRKTEESK